MSAHHISSLLTLAFSCFPTYRMLPPSKSQFFTVLCPFFLLTIRFFSFYSSTFFGFDTANPPPHGTLSPPPPSQCDTGKDPPVLCPFFLLTSPFFCPLDFDFFCLRCHSSPQGGPKFLKKEQGSIFFELTPGLGLTKYVSGRLSIYGNSISIFG